MVDYFYTPTCLRQFEDGSKSHLKDIAKAPRKHGHREQMLAIVQKGDRVLVESVEEIGTSEQDILYQVAKLNMKGVPVVTQSGDQEFMFRPHELYLIMSACKPKSEKPGPQPKLAAVMDQRPETIENLRKAWVCDAIESVVGVDVSNEILRDAGFDLTVDTFVLHRLFGPKRMARAKAVLWDRSNADYPRPLWRAIEDGASYNMDDYYPQRGASPVLSRYICEDKVVDVLSVKRSGITKFVYDLAELNEVDQRAEAYKAAKANRKKAGGRRKSELNQLIEGNPTLKSHLRSLWKYPVTVNEVLEITSLLVPDVEGINANALYRKFGRRLDMRGTSENYREDLGDEVWRFIVRDAEIVVDAAEISSYGPMRGELHRGNQVLYYAEDGTKILLRP